MIFQTARVIRSAEIRDPSGRPGRSHGGHHWEYQHQTGSDYLWAHAQQAAWNDVTHHMHRANHVNTSEPVFLSRIINTTVISNLTSRVHFLSSSCVDNSTELIWEDNIRKDRQKIIFYIVGRTDVAQDRDKWWNLLKVVMDLGFIKCREFLDYLRNFKCWLITKGYAPWHQFP